MHQETIIEGFSTVFLKRAYKSLISDCYPNFVVTVGFIGVAIYCNGNMVFKIFDSHASDLYGRGHPQGTCVLLDIPSLISLVHYFHWLWWQGWPSGESTCLPPMWPGFDFRTRCHMWIEFVGPLLCHERFFPEYSGFPLSSKTNI